MRTWKQDGVIALCCCAMLGVALWCWWRVAQERRVPEPAAVSETVRGTASWYGEELAGRPTASGEPFNPAQYTCASWDYPFGTWLKITAQTSGRVVVCRVNDRGPNKRLGRLVDLSEASFALIAPLERGLVGVTVEQVK